MSELRSLFNDSDRFALGIELLTTRGTINEAKATDTRDFAQELSSLDEIDWISITDNAGGNPQLSPVALGKPLLYSGKEVIIHLSCKDFNRNGLESTAWQLASEGFRNILALSGDYPISGYSGVAKPVFDIDSVGLLTLLNEMNQGLGVSFKNGAKKKNPLIKTDFFLGAVATNFKLTENEVVPQYLKLKKKIAVGAEFIITQIGFDSRKSSEMFGYLKTQNLGHIPLIGDTFLMTKGLAKFFNTGKTPGVVVTDPLLETCNKAAQSPDKGKQFFLELVAKQIAIYKGLKYKGAYLGGIDHIEDLNTILEKEKSFSKDDWKGFANELLYSQPGEFFFFAQNKKTELADFSKLNPEYEASLKKPQKTRHVTWRYKINQMIHNQLFTPGKPLFRLGKKIFTNSANPLQGPKALRVIEHVSKAVLFNCQDCGDCSLPDIAYLCPESACAKNQRNGPCGGTRQGICEVEEFDCIWSIAYDRLKYEGKEQTLLDHAPVIQNQAFRHTSSWGNTWLEKDHHANNPHKHIENN